MDVHRVRLAGADAAFDCAADDTLLRAAQRAGLGFPYECNVGSCGNCRFELQEGEVATLWGEAPGLAEKDRQRGRRLGCQTQPRGDCTLRLRTMPRYVPVHRPVRTAATLVARRPVTHDIHEFRFALAQPAMFAPGQYALVNLPGVTGPRAYSMSNIAGDGSAWDFQVRLVPTGRGSPVLFGLQPGAAVHIDGPYGMAWLRADAPRDILCIAGGSGLAPMLSIARGAFAEPALAGRRLHFVYGGRTPADLCGQAELQALPGWRERGSWHGIVSLPRAGYAGATGYVHEAVRQLHAGRLPDFEIYFAGPAAMTTAVQQVLLESGVPPEQQHFDQFY